MGSNFHYVIYPVNQNNEYNFVAILKKKLTLSEINNTKLFQNEDFLDSLKDVLIKNSVTKFGNLGQIKAFPVFVTDFIILL